MKYQESALEGRKVLEEKEEEGEEEGEREVKIQTLHRVNVKM